MPLKLVIGPANAEKARVALDDHRAWLEAGREPLLVVPTLADVRAYRRELAATGAVFGVEVMRFAWLIREIAERAGMRGRPVGALARARVAALALGSTRLEALGASARTPGFPDTLLGLIAELEELRLDPPRVIAALRRWAQDEPGRHEYADELGALYAAYRRELGRLGVLDTELHAAAALDALRLAPETWRGTPVALYGFDDLSALQRDTIETLACHAGAELTLTLTYEPGRAAHASRAKTFEELRALPGAEVVELAARADHYAPASRAALHHLERTLFEDDAPAAAAGDALLLLEGGGERAEVELVGAHVARLLRDGWDPEEIAVVWRSPWKTEALIAEVFDSLDIPIAMSRRVPAAHTAIGRGLLALLRCALLGGTADDLLAYLRTPGLLDRPELADGLEVRVRQNGIRTAVQARGLWEERHWPLEAIDRVAQAHERGPAALCERLARECAWLFARPHRGRAPILDGHERLDAAAEAALGGTLRELGGLARRDAALLPAPAELHRLLSELDVFAGESSAPGCVQVTAPPAIRARRVRALFLCGLVEGSFPKADRPDPLLSDEDRAEINRVSGLRLAHHTDHLAAERFLLYTAVSRPTDLLALSWRTADDDGEPEVRSLFVDDVLDRFTDSLAERVHTRPLGAAGWEGDQAPSAHEAALAAAAAAPPLAPETIAPLSAETVVAARPPGRPWSATEIESWSGCPVKWFVERVLHPDDLTPDPEPLLRGTAAHEVLRAVFEAFRGHPLEPADLPQAREIMHAALARAVQERPLSVDRERLLAAVRRLEVDLLRHLEHAATDGSALAPERFEESFELDVGPLRLQGRIDRIDVGGGEAVIVDYKGKTAHAGAKWIDERKLQLGLYLLAARELARQGALDAEPVGGIYQPLGSDDERPRGLMLSDADPGRVLVSTDRVSREEFEAVLADVLEAAERVVEELRAGALEPRPGTCAWKGGCSYPSICRCETA